MWLNSADLLHINFALVGVGVGLLCLPHCIVLMSPILMWLVTCRTKGALLDTWFCIWKKACIKFDNNEAPFNVKALECDGDKGEQVQGNLTSMWISQKWNAPHLPSSPIYGLMHQSISAEPIPSPGIRIFWKQTLANAPGPGQMSLSNAPQYMFRLCMFCLVVI